MPILIAWLCAVFALGGVAYYVLCIWSARAFLRTSPAASGFTPSVSILKPLKGIDPEIYEAFRSHCLQRYSEFEIIFGVSDPNDAAIPLVRRLQQEFPKRRIELVVAERSLGANGKISTLAQMLPHARFDHLIVNDSDIVVQRDYLARVMAPFADPSVGMVTCLYRGIAGRTLGSKLEAIGIGTDFIAGVLSARVLQGVKFGLGSTLAFKRGSLEKIGGFEALVDHLADDYELGARIAANGERVVVSDVMVDHHLPPYKFGEFFQHQLRWARAVRDSRKLDYVGLGFTFGLPWSLLAVAFSLAAQWSFWLLAAALVTRLLMAFVVAGGVLGDRRVLRNIWLLPLRDVIALLVWIASFAGHTIVWRGDRFVLENGRLRPAK